MADEKARDIIGQIAPRMVCGEDMLHRIGRRAWTRPRVAVSNRLYKLYRVPDPWDPDARKDSTPIGLGPVSLRLGQERRQPAPHLKPKPTKKEKGKQTLADKARATPRPPQAVKPKPAKVSPNSPTLEAKAKAKAAEEARAAEVVARMRAAEAARGKTRRRAPVDQPGKEEHATPTVPVRPDIAEATLARSKQDGGSPAIQPPSRPKGKSSRGRFRMAPKKVTSASVEKPVNVPVESVPKREEQDTVELPVRTRSMPSAGGGSMDDMFAAAAQMGRLSMRQSPPESEGDGEE